MEYKVVCVIWEDHTQFARQPLTDINPKKDICTTISFGFIYKETKKSLTLVYDLERLPDEDAASFIIILKGCILAVKEYGTIPITKIR